VEVNELVGDSIGPRWSRSPKYVLRAACIDELTGGWTAGEFAEFGAGTATMTRNFVSRGFHGHVYDLGAETRAALRRDVFPTGAPVRVVDAPEEIPDASVDYLMAFEVLEHIDDDHGVLESWARKLRPAGQVVVSVPAHMRKFSATDDRVGHVRRYERAELRTLLEACGFGELRIANYGFPLGNVSRRVMRVLERRGAAAVDVADKVDRSVRSGVEQPGAVNRLAGVVNDRTLAPFISAQRRFFDRDLGDGYVAVGRLAS
jgi:SAM-dependent methyltransferase